MTSEYGDGLLLRVKSFTHAYQYHVPNQRLDGVQNDADEELYVADDLTDTQAWRHGFQITNESKYKMLCLASIHQSPEYVTW